MKVDRAAWWTLGVLVSLPLLWFAYVFVTSRIEMHRVSKEAERFLRDWTRGDLHDVFDGEEEG